MSETSRKADGLSRDNAARDSAFALRRGEAMVQRATIRPLLVTTTQRPSWRADRVDAAEAGHGIAGIDFEDALPALDQRAAIGDVAQDPAFDGRQPRHFGLGRPSAGARRRDRAGDFLGAAGAGAAATGRGRRRRGRASFSTASLSLASLAAGSACAFSTLSRRSLVLLNWAMPILEACSMLAFRARISASIRATEASSAGCRGGGAASLPRNAQARGRHGAAERARHRRQRHHRGQRGQPALAEHALGRFGFRLRAGVCHHPRCGRRTT